MKRKWLIGPVALGLTLLLAACGGPSQSDVREAVKVSFNRQIELIGGNPAMLAQQEQAVDRALDGLRLEQCTKTFQRIYECTVTVQGMVKKVQMTQNDGKWYAVIQN